MRHTPHYYANNCLSWVYKHSLGLHLLIQATFNLLNLLVCLDRYHCCSLRLSVHHCCVKMTGSICVYDVWEFTSRPDSETTSQPYTAYCMSSVRWWYWHTGRGRGRGIMSAGKMTGSPKSTDVFILESTCRQHISYQFNHYHSILVRSAAYRTFCLKVAWVSIEDFVLLLLLLCGLCVPDEVVKWQAAQSLLNCLAVNTRGGISPYSLSKDVTFLLFTKKEKGGACNRRRFALNFSWSSRLKKWASHWQKSESSLALFLTSAFPD